MANPSVFAAIEIEDESSFAEDVDAFADLRLPIIGMVDTTGLHENKIDPGRTQQTQQGGDQYINGTQLGSTIKIRVPLPGHGSPTTGAIQISAFETFLGYAFGAAVRSADSGDTATGGTAGVPTTTGANGFAAGSLCRVGELGDGRGEGQFAVVGDHSGNNLTLLTELPGAPAAADAIHSTVLIHTLESPTNTALTSFRLRILTANQRYSGHGCVITGVTLSPWSVGTTPYAEFDVAIARWKEIDSGIFPSALATEPALEAPITAGSVFLAAVGVSARAGNVYVARDVKFTWTLNTALLKGYGGVSSQQEIVAARRLPATITADLTVDAEANTAAPAIPTLARAQTNLHLLVTGSVAPSSAIGAYFPRMCAINIPTQQDVEGINRFTLSLRAYTGLTATSELTQSAARIALG